MTREQKLRIDSFLKVMPYLKDVLQDDVMVALADREKFLSYYPGINLRMQGDITGKPIPEGDPLLDSMAKKKIGISIVPEEVFGISFRAITYPLIDKSGECFGGIGIAKSLKTEFDLNKSINQISGEVNRSRDLTEGLFTNIENIAQEMDHNAAAVEESLAGILEISDQSDEISSEMNMAKKYSNDMKNNAESGEQSISNISDAMNNISDSSTSVARLINNLEESIMKVDSIADSITTLSDQTNLLALNAAIEAARAGEQGKGFAVVADEVRKLAEESKIASNEIRTLIDSIKNETVEVEAAVSQTEKNIKDGEQYSIDTRESFFKIIESAELVDNQINVTLKKADNQALTSREISQAIESIAESITATQSNTTEIKDASSELKELISAISEDLMAIMKLSDNMFSTDVQ